MRNEIEYEWSEEKNQANIKKHGLSFELVYLIELREAVIVSAYRENDREVRLKAVVAYNETLYVVVFVYRALKVRLISLRRANNTEQRLWYDQE